ncbi:MAG TPA: type II secretion system F family protein [Gemmataceae bacterium]|nr:type II secretion system F family protein [Gemmataceae bacterium]
MIFSARLSLSSMIEVCRAMRHYLTAGLSLRETFRHLARRGPSSVRPVAGRISARLERGDDLQAALKGEQKVFPPLFCSLVAVGEETGSLPDVAADLEKYYVQQQRLRRRFLGMIAFPVLELNAAILVIAGMIWLLGFLTEMVYGPNQQPVDPLGIGLTGNKGALTVLLVSYGFLAALLVSYKLAKVLFRGRAPVDRFLLATPVIGRCLKALALSRFCLALRLTWQAGLSAPRAVAMSLRATGNAAFQAAEGVARGAVREGEDLTVALARTGLFPHDFQSVLAVAEDTGRLPEVLQQQTEHYQEEAGRRLAVLNTMAAVGLMLLIGSVIVLAIFRLFFFYLDQLDPAKYGL